MKIKASRIIPRFCLTGFLAMILLLQGTLFAGDNEIEFKGAIVRIDKTSNTALKLTVALSAPTSGGPQTTVLVDDLTWITGSGDIALTVADLVIGQFIEVRGVFTSAGIYARRMEVEAENETKDEFHLRGALQNPVSSNGVTTFTVGGITVLANSSTRIQSRGLGGTLTLADLAPGQPVEVKGILQNGQIIATIIEIGQRLQDRADLEFHGTVTAINGNSVTIEISKQPPITVVVNTTDLSRIEGILMVGVEVEIKAIMGRDFTISVQKIEVAGAPEKEHGNDVDNSGVSNGGSGNGSSGNNSSGNSAGGSGGNGNAPQMMEREIELIPTPDAPPGADGEADVEFESQQGAIQQEFKVKGDKLKAQTTYSVQVSFDAGFLRVGSFITDDRGRGEMVLRCGATCPGFPAGKDVRQIKAVRVVNGSNGVVLQGNF